MQQNLIRKALYYNYNYYHSIEVEFNDSNLAQRLHICECFLISETSSVPPVTHVDLAHCLDILRQRLMCTMDIGVFGKVWVRNGTLLRPFVDLNTKHVCRNFDSIRAWAEERQISKDVPEDFIEKPVEGVNILSGIP